MADTYQILRSWHQFSICCRDESDLLAPILASPDAWMAKGRQLKDGAGTRLALIEYAGQQFVLKRYNIKGLWHGLGRGIRPSRAWRCWLDGHALRSFGIATPRPVAVIEQRLGPWRRAAWLLCEYCPGERISTYWQSDERPSETELAVVESLFHGLRQFRISHGDMKKNNILWHEGRLVLIDLDSMRRHRWHWAFAAAHAKDRARFLRNWPAESALHQALASRLDGQ